MELKRSATPFTVYIPDTRGVVESPYGLGNLKIGPDVFSYSRLPGRSGRFALGHVDSSPVQQYAAAYPKAAGRPDLGTCPGSTPECERICYARRPVQENGPVLRMWTANSLRRDVPPIPEACKLLRIHVSGDFDTVEYIESWISRLTERPDVKAWAYTRSWRVPELLPAMERLRALPNIQVFASMDKSTKEMPPEGWRRAWIDGDPRAGSVHKILAHTEKAEAFKAFELQQTGDQVKALICPEETKAVKNCQECGFCISGLRNDVIFLEH